MVPTADLSPLFIALTSAALMSSRIIGFSFRFAGKSDDSRESGGVTALT
jgi:hypothetical protein